VPLDRTLVDRLQRVLAEASICGLGHVALNPLFSAARHWPDEVPLPPAGEASNEG